MRIFTLSFSLTLRRGYTPVAVLEGEIKGVGEKPPEASAAPPPAS